MAVGMALVEKRADLLRLPERHGVKHVSVFGSLAQGEASPGSDLDLLVDVDEGRSLFDLIAFKLDAEELLGRKVDVVTRAGLSPYLAPHILTSEVPL